MDSFTLDTNNLPLARPGIYMLLHNASGRCYVGMSKNVKRRMGQYTRGYASKRIKGAIRKYGFAAFTAVPIFYMLEYEMDQLQSIEAELIARYSAYGPRGFNMVPASKGVVWTPEFRKARSDTVLKMFADPEWGPKRRAEVSAFAKAQWNDPATRKSLLEAIRKGLNRPEVRERKSRSLKATMADPEMRAKRSVATRQGLDCPEKRERTSKKVKERWLDPEYRAKMRAKKSNGDALRAKWRDPEYRARMVAAHTGKRQSAETIAKRVPKLKASWKLPSEMRMSHVSTLLGRKCINNSIVSRTVLAGSEIPEGWVWGRLPNLKRKK